MTWPTSQIRHAPQMSMETSAVISETLFVSRLAPDFFLKKALFTTNMKVFRDLLYGEIQVSEVAVGLIDTLEFQRLRSINQTGAAKFVFPSATTTRFEHSIGTYHLTGIFLLQLGIPETDRRHELIKIGGLMHDIGHGPFSHLFDHKCLSSFSGPWATHEKRSQSIFRQLARDRFDKLDTDFICEVILPRTSLWYMNVVNNSLTGIDADKLDYIVRDNRAFGLHLDVDVQRLVANAKIVEGKLCFCSRVGDDLANLFFVRNRLYRHVYSHRVIQRVENILAQIIGEFPVYEILEKQDVNAFCQLTDSYVEIKGDVSKWRAIAERRLPEVAPGDLVLPEGSSSAFNIENLWLFPRNSQVLTPFPVSLLQNFVTKK